jgi:SAM-dependent methyltransferase
MHQEHAELFGTWDRYATRKLVRLCNQFNECQLFRTLVGNEDCRTLSDVGCATGRFYRFFRTVWPTLEYKGFDISAVAIEEARRHFPKGSFRVFDGNLKSVPEIGADIVWCRDVVHHQTDPGGFLSDLYDTTGKYLILRVRTREVGSTVFDVSQSCQYTYGNWVPYIVFNTSELIDLVRSFKPVPAKITLWRHPVVLGGQNGRFSPKELYYPETGTAEASVLIQKGIGNRSENTVVTIETRPEAGGQNVMLWARWLRQLARRWGL